MTALEYAVLDGAIPAPSVPQARPSPAGEIFTRAGHRYQLVREPMTWDDAKKRAEGLGAHLATITSAEEEAWFRATFVPMMSPTSALWLGASYDADGKPWRWVTGEAWAHASWQPGHPASNQRNTEQWVLEYGQQNGQSVWRSVLRATSANKYSFVEWDDDGTPRGKAAATPAPGSGPWVDALAAWWAQPEAQRGGEMTKVQQGSRITDGSKSVGLFPSNGTDRVVRATLLFPPEPGARATINVRTSGSVVDGFSRYFAAVNRDGASVIGKHVKDKVVILAKTEAPRDFAADKSHIIELSSVGDTLVLKIDGKPSNTIRDTDYAQGWTHFLASSGVIIEKLEYLDVAAGPANKP
jgi:hypothetical protein